MREEIEEFRDGIFALRTRRFGTVAELMIRKLFGLQGSKSLSYDLLGNDKGAELKVEVKFSTVMKQNDATIRAENLIEQCKKANLANRAMRFDELGKYPFDCNIQQVKCSEFDLLYYGLFFADLILIFSMRNDEVAHCPNSSDKQHRGNRGEGQFHLNGDSIGYHLERHKLTAITYEELYDLFANNA